MGLNSAISTQALKNEMINNGLFFSQNSPLSLQMLPFKFQILLFALQVLPFTNQKEKLNLSIQNRDLCESSFHRHI